MTWMTRAGDFRYVRASISTELLFDQMIATVAHELQHAVEVIEDESVTDERSLVELYKRIGQPSRAAGRPAGKHSPLSARARKCGANWWLLPRPRWRRPATANRDVRVRSCYAVAGKRAPSASSSSLGLPAHATCTEDFYGFVQSPFSLTPDPRFLYRSESHDVALQQVWQAIRRKEGFIVLTGDIGTGKTTISRTLLEQFDETTFTALILNPFLSVEELLREVLLSFGVVSKDALKTGRLATASKHELVRTLHDFLLSLVPLHGSAVLIIDEAQHLSSEVLEEIRVLSNLETNDQKLLQVVIVGQLNLIEMLHKPDLRQLDQRISIRCYLKPLTREEVEAYVTHRLWVARGSTPVTFTPRAFDLVHSITGGIPRMINLVCDRALMAACEQQTSRINEDNVVKAAAQLGHEIPKGKIKGEKGETTTTTAAAAMPQPEAPSRRPLLIGAVSAVAALVIAAMIWLIGNPMSTGPAVEPPEPPAPAVAASAEALPPPADMPVPALVPPPVAESFSIVVGTYDSAARGAAGRVGASRAEPDSLHDRHPDSARRPSAPVVAGTVCHPRRSGSSESQTRIAVGKCARHHRLVRTVSRAGPGLTLAILVEFFQRLIHGLDLRLRVDLRANVLARFEALQLVL